MLDRAVTLWKTLGQYGYLDLLESCIHFFPKWINYDQCHQGE